jgi:hypothetical protein
MEIPEKSQLTADEPFQVRNCDCKVVSVQEFTNWAIHFWRDVQAG